MGSIFIIIYYWMPQFWVGSSIILPQPPSYLEGHTFMLVNGLLSLAGRTVMASPPIIFFICHIRNFLNYHCRWAVIWSNFYSISSIVYVKVLLSWFGPHSLVSRNCCNTRRWGWDLDISLSLIKIFHPSNSVYFSVEFSDIMRCYKQLKAIIAILQEKYLCLNWDLNHKFPAVCTDALPS